MNIMEYDMRADCITFCHAQFSCQINLTLNPNRKSEGRREEINRELSPLFLYALIFQNPVRLSPTRSRIPSFFSFRICCFTPLIPIPNCSDNSSLVI